MAFNNSILMYYGDGTSFDSECEPIPNVKSCTITEELNGEYELEMVCPFKSELFPGIDAIVLAKPNETDGLQPFRVYEISIPFNGLSTIYAHHISYDLNGIPVAPFTASSVAGALSGIASHAYTTCPFTFETSETDVADFVVNVPFSARSVLSSIIQTYGGNLKYDKRNVTYYSWRHENSGNRIRYGYNLTGINKNANAINSFNGIIPFWKSSGEDETLVIAPEIDATYLIDVKVVIPKDFSSAFESQPTIQELSAYAQAWFNENAPISRKDTITVSFADLSRTEEYKNKELTPISLGDLVFVIDDDIGVRWEYYVVSLKYDAINGKVISVTLSENNYIGSTKQTLSDTIVSISKDVDTKTNATEVRQAAKVSSSSVGTSNKTWFETYRNAVPKAVPYTSTSSGLSEIVTKQDLINLGLI